VRRGSGRLTRRSDEEEERLLAEVLADSRGLIVTIRRACRELRVYESVNGRPMPPRSYRVGVGRRDAQTPAGSFRIQSMLVDPVWHVPDDPRTYGALAGRPVPAGSPENRIVARWLGFHGGIGIHGIRQGRFGIGSSDGCVLMTAADVVDLYSRLELETPVIVS
jgi:lipoprotein-anchoring transpeptidase ErfK/SrfK